MVLPVSQRSLHQRTLYKHVLLEAMQAGGASRDTKDGLMRSPHSAQVEYTSRLSAHGSALQGVKGVDRTRTDKDRQAANNRGF